MTGRRSSVADILNVFKVKDERTEKLVAYSTIAALSAYMAATSCLLFNWYDVHYFDQWYHQYLKTGLLSVYSHCPKVHYPPLAVIFYIGLRLFTVNVFHATSLWATVHVFKAVLVACYALLCLLIVREFRWPIAQWGVLSVPAGSVIWGVQFDVIIALLTFVALERAWKGKPLSSGLALAAASAFKFVPGVLLLPITAVMWAKHGKRSLVPLLTSFFGFTVIVWGPFFLYDPRAFLWQVFEFHMYRIPQDLTIFNLPIAIHRWKVTHMAFLLGKISGWVLIAGTLVFGLYPFFKKQKVERMIKDLGMKYTVIGLSAPLMLWFLLTTKVGNPYYITWAYLPVFPLACNVIHPLPVAMIDAAAFYYPTSLMPAAILGKKVFIAEDLKWENAVKLMRLSSLAKVSRHYLLTHPPSWYFVLAPVLALLTGREISYHRFLDIWYQKMHLVVSFVIIVYTFFVALALYQVLSWLRDPSPVDERPHDWIVHPVLAVVTLPAFLFGLSLLLTAVSRLF